MKYLYKAVPCTPCPCECPDSRAREAAPAPVFLTVGGEEPVDLEAPPVSVSLLPVSADTAAITPAPVPATQVADARPL